MHKNFIYAETAFHHEGDFDYLLKLVDMAAKAGMDGIKFQVLVNVNELLSTYNPGFETVKKCVFSYAQWITIFDYAINLNLELIVMPLDRDSFKLVNSYRKHIRFLELHSVSYYDEIVKEQIKETGLNIILGVGGRTLAEIEEAKTYFGGKLTVLMTGFQSFPSTIEDIRIRKIKELKEKFPLMDIGYADHSGYDDPWCVESNSIAYMLGAAIFEKHITLEEGVKRIDYESAVGVDKLTLIKNRLDQLYGIVEDYHDAFEMTSAEVSYRNRQKMAVAVRALTKGEVIAPKDFSLKMTGKFDGFSRMQDLAGKTLLNNISIDEIIKKDDVN